MFFHHPTGIHSLPVELLTRIFALGATDDHPYSRSPFLLKPVQDYYPVPSTQFQLTTSHVCRHWRHVALCSPSLWSTLCFRETSHIPRAQAFLARCSPNPNRRLDILVDTVAPEDHIPGVTLCQKELPIIFSLIMPHVSYWRAFHLKIRDNICKLQARQNLGGACPAPNLETLQLYHFENFRTTQNLYIATHRSPVKIFSNSLPKLRNVSLIGVNLLWDQSPYLRDLHTLELALHPENIRPPYKYWDRMLRYSPALQRLFLHYSGPKVEDSTDELAWTPLEDVNSKGKGKEDECVLLESLSELSLTDLDADYLCLLSSRLVMPNMRKLTLHLPDQDYAPFIELIVPCTQFPESTLQSAIVHCSETYPDSSSSDSISSLSPWDTHSVSSGSSTPVHSPTSTSASASSTLAPSITTTSISVSSISNNGFTAFKRSPLPGLTTTLETLIITALDCSFPSWKTFIRSLLVLRVLEVNFGKVWTKGGEKSDEPSWSVLIERFVDEVKGDGGMVKRERMVLPQLRKCKMAGLPGWTVRRVVVEREREKERRWKAGEWVGDMEWLVVEDKDARRDAEMADIFERGIWCGGGDGNSGAWAKVSKVVKEEEEYEDEEDEDEEDEGEDEEEEDREESEEEAYERNDYGAEEEDTEGSFAADADQDQEMEEGIPRLGVLGASSSKLVQPRA